MNQINNETNKNIEDYKILKDSNSLIIKNKKDDKEKLTEEELFSYFNNVYYVESLKDYINILNILSTSYRLEIEEGEIIDKINIKYVFRGISSLSQLKPGIFRNYTSRKDDKLYEASLTINEEKYLKNFEEIASSLSGEFNNPLDFISFAQHYGIKTRLLDWTHSFLIATLFSLYDSDSKFNTILFKDLSSTNIVKNLPYDTDHYDSLTYKYKCMIDLINECIGYCSELEESSKTRAKTTIYSVHADYDNWLEGFDESDKDLINLIIKNIYKILGADEINHYHSLDPLYISSLFNFFINQNENLFIETNYSSDRIKNQKGLFELYCFSNIKYDCIFIKKDDDLRKQIIEYINTLGINYFSLMNDLHSISTNICKMVDEEIEIK